MTALKKIQNIASTALVLLAFLCAVFLRILAGIIAIPILLGLLVSVCLLSLYLYMDEFLLELRYLNKELQHAEGPERRHWIRQRRRLWLSLIPFVKY